MDPSPVRKKTRSDRPKKRKFQGNQHSKKAEPEEKMCDDTRSSSEVGASLEPETSSSKKLKAYQEEKHVEVSSDIEGYRFADISGVVRFVMSMPCKLCMSSKKRGRYTVCEPAYTVKETLKGLWSVISIVCDYCKEESKLDLSPSENVNLRFQYSMYSVGVHDQKSKRFLASMNMPGSVGSARASDFREKIHSAVKSVAEESMKSAAEELKSESDEAAVSCDGTWQKRGFISKNGVSTVLSVSKESTAKVIDVEVLSNYCDSCAKAKKKFSEEEFNEFTKNHVCQKNHDGTAGSMEPVGMVRIFERSVETKGLKYTKYLGDGDSKSYRQVCDADVYDGKSIEKLECCGHVQKRMGKRLMDKVAQCKGKKYKENGKMYTGIGGAGRLTAKAIKRIQGHYGGAIRKNTGNLEGMRKSIWAIFHHRSGNHEFCGEWCKKDDKNILPKFVLDEIKPVFEFLSSDDLLKKCLHGGTQNNNESFHNLIWNRCPKNIFVGRQRLEIAVFDAAIVFNDGELGRVDIFKKLNLKCGKFTIDGFRNFDGKRIKKSTDRTSTDKKKQRQLKQQSESNTADDTYEAGAY